MTAAAETLLSSLLKLPEDDRIELAERLQQSVNDMTEDEPISDELRATLDRRWEEIESGKVKCRDAFEVLTELRAKYNV